MVVARGLREALGTTRCRRRRRHDGSGGVRCRALFQGNPPALSASRGGGIMGVERDVFSSLFDAGQRTRRACVLSGTFRPMRPHVPRPPRGMPERPRAPGWCPELEIRLLSPCSVPDAWAYPTAPSRRLYTRGRCCSGTPRTCSAGCRETPSCRGTTTSARPGFCWPTCSSGDHASRLAVKTPPERARVRAALHGGREGAEEPAPLQTKPPLSRTLSCPSAPWCLDGSMREPWRVVVR